MSKAASNLAAVARFVAAVALVASVFWYDVFLADNPLLFKPFERLWPGQACFLFATSTLMALPAVVSFRIGAADVFMGSIASLCSAWLNYGFQAADAVRLVSHDAARFMSYADVALVNVVGVFFFVDALQRFRQSVMYAAVAAVAAVATGIFVGHSSASENWLSHGLVHAMAAGGIMLYLFPRYVAYAERFGTPWPGGHLRKPSPGSASTTSTTASSSHRTGTSCATRSWRSTRNAASEVL